MALTAQLAASSVELPMPGSFEGSRRWPDVWFLSLEDRLHLTGDLGGSRAEVLALEVFAGVMRFLRCSSVSRNALRCVASA